MAKQKEDNQHNAPVQPSERKSDKFLEARETLPEELRETYDRLVDEYHFATIQKYGTGYVAYPVLAELVRSGWRPLNS
jgi:hypothetical protein